MQIKPHHRCGKDQRENKKYAIDLVTAINITSAGDLHMGGYWATWSDGHDLGTEGRVWNVDSGPADIIMMSLGDLSSAYKQVWGIGRVWVPAPNSE